jgi:hypothetical protein
MNELTYTRLIWQIPVLILISALFMPNVPWYSSTFGFWPIWVLSMPVIAFMRNIYLARNELTVQQAVNQSQVLVFRQKPRTGKENAKYLSKVA